MKKILIALFITFYFPVYSDHGLTQCPDGPTIYSFQVGDNTTTCLTASECASSYNGQVPDYNGAAFSSVYEAHNTQITFIVTLSSGGTRTRTMSVQWACGEIQCQGMDQEAPFVFQGEQDYSQNFAPAQICQQTCTATLDSTRPSYTFKHGTESTSYIGIYQFTEAPCDLNSDGTATPIAGTDLQYNTPDNNNLQLPENKELCATDSESGQQVCIPLLEAGTASITDQQGRDYELDPQGENCGIVNGEFKCLPSNQTGIAQITDSDGNVFTINNPKNPINNPIINNMSGDSDSDWTLTVNNNTNSTVQNNTNTTGGDPNDPKSQTGGTANSVDTQAITNSINALKTSNKTELDQLTNNVGQSNNKLDGISNKVGITNEKLDSINESINDIGKTSDGKTMGENLKSIEQAVLDGKTDMGPTVQAINNVNNSVQQVKTEIEKITNSEYTDNPEVISADDTYSGFYEKLQTVPIVQAYQNISLSFSSGTCQTPNISFEILGNNVNGDLSFACTVIEDIKTVLGLVMLLVYGFIGSRIVISA